MFALSLVSYALNKIPMALTAFITLTALVLTNCIDVTTAMTGFSSTSTIIIAGMFVISAALNKTSFIDKMSKSILSLSGGSFKRAYLAYIILAALLTSFLTSPMVAYSIVFPLATAMCKDFNVSPSKVQFALVVVCIGCCAVLPFGYTINAVSQYNGFLEAYNFVDVVINPIDFTIGRLPLMLVILGWAYFIAPKFAPDQPVVPISAVETKTTEKKALKKSADIAGVVIFALTIFALLFNTQLGIASWKIVMVASIATVLFGTLTDKEAFNAIPLNIIFLFAGATGAGELVGSWMANIVGGTQNNYILGAVFFIAPFIMTQFMQNQGVMNIFVPIALLTCQALGANPIGLCILITAACLTAFLTPMATAAIPMCMGAGGYDIKSLFKQGWLISIFLMVGYVFYTMTMFPAF